MVDKMDWQAAMSSEIFREYAANETARMRREAQIAEQAKAHEAEEELALLEQFAAMELEIKDSPKKLAAFKALQEKFATDASYAEKVNPLFVKAVMMLNLKD